MINDDEKKVNSNDNLDELMKTATQKISDDYGDNNGINKKKKSTKKVIVLTISGLLLFAGILSAGAIFMNKPQSFEDKTKIPDWVEKKDEEEYEDDLIDEWDFEVPVELKDWASNPYISEAFWDNKKIEGVLLEEAREKRGLYSATSWMKSGLPSPYDDEEIAGPYTNDISKRYAEDGVSDNPEFSYALAEDYQKAYILYTERLLNPTFGGWSSMQYSDVDIKRNIKFNQLKDMFSNQWWKENIENPDNYKNLPILVEWEKGDWDKYSLPEKETTNQGIFYGEVVEDEDRYISIENIGIDEENQAILKVNSPVKYYAKDINDDLIEITGTLELTLQSNSENLNVENRVIITEAKLMLDN